jgi:hypothetical protein
MTSLKPSSACNNPCEHPLLVFFLHKVKHALHSQLRILCDRWKPWVKAVSLTDRWYKLLEDPFYA